MRGLIIRVIIVMIVALVAATAIYKGPFTPLATAEMPPVNVP
jgi:hypothetical protein